MATVETAEVKMDVKREWKKQRLGVVGWILLAVSVVLIVMSALWFYNASVLRDENELLQASLLEERANLLHINDTDYSTQYVQQMMYSAEEAGNAVSDAINAAHAIEWDALDAGQEPDWNAMKFALEHVSDYFPSSYENGASWYAARNPKDGDHSEWSFMTTFSFSHNTINCLWLCHRQSDGQIMAYATALYDAESGVFTSFNFAENHHITTYGNVWKAEINDVYFEDDDSSDVPSDGSIVDEEISDDIPESTHDTEDVIGGED